MVKQVVNGFPLEGLQNTSYLKAREKLTQLYGIGEKIADCILLFSLDYLEAFPIDTWMVRILRSEYFPKYSGRNRKLAELARRKFGSFAGYAQQYLYHYARSRKYQSV
ncbi:MAG: hypothetical protein P8Y60_15350 [Calditrichota bacterium]